MTSSSMTTLRNSGEKYISRKHAYWNTKATLDDGLVMNLDVLILCRIEDWKLKFFIFVCRSELLKKAEKL